MRPAPAAAGLALGLLVAVGAPSSAGAATSVIEVGWWTSSPFASAPDGGVAVGADPTGPTTVAAIRLDLGRGVTRAVIRLTEAGGFAQEVAAVQVCRGDDGWTAEAGGDRADAPANRCGTSPLLLEEAEGEWSADVTSLVGGDTRPTLMLLPTTGADPTGTLGLGWEVQFEAPALDADEVGGSDPPPASPDSTAPPPATTRTVSPTPARPARSSPSPAPARHHDDLHDRAGRRRRGWRPGGDPPLRGTGQRRNGAPVGSLRRLRAGVDPDRRGGRGRKLARDGGPSLEAPSAVPALRLLKTPSDATVRDLRAEGGADPSGSVGRL